MKKNTIALLLVLLGCSGTNDHLSFIQSSGAGFGSNGDIQVITACSIASPDSNVFVGELQSAMYVKRVCGQDLPSSYTEYKLIVETPIIGRGEPAEEIVVVGTDRWPGLPATATAGDEFLIVFRKVESRFMLSNWVQLQRSSNATVDSTKTVDLPSKEDDLVTAIRDGLNESCDRFGFLTSDESLLKNNWYHTNCNAALEPPREGREEETDETD